MIKEKLGLSCIVLKAIYSRLVSIGSSPAWAIASIAWFGAQQRGEPDRLAFAVHFGRIEMLDEVDLAAIHIQRYPCEEIHPRNPDPDKGGWQPQLIRPGTNDSTQPLDAAILRALQTEALAVEGGVSNPVFFYAECCRCRLLIEANVCLDFKKPVKMMVEIGGKVKKYKNR